MEQKPAPLLKEAKAGKRLVYFAGAVYYVYRAFVIYLWCLKRIFMPVPSCRNRYGVLGAIDVISHDFVTVCPAAFASAIGLFILYHFFLVVNLKIILFE